MGHWKFCFKTLKIRSLTELNHKHFLKTSPSVFLVFVIFTFIIHLSLATLLSTSMTPFLVMCYVKILAIKECLFMSTSTTKVS